MLAAIVHKSTLHGNTMATEKWTNQAFKSRFNSNYSEKDQ